MTSSNILPLPFRKSNHLSFKPAIKKYISDQYDQHPDMFRNDMDVIDALRKDAINVREAHPSGIKKLQVYAAQLTWMGGKFPIDIGLDFSWYPAMGYRTEQPVVKNNLKFELSNVLYNLAALYSQLAISSNRGDTNGLKSAANYLGQAAGVLSYIKDSINPELRTDPTEDMDGGTLEALKQLMLAQAQECFWQKAVMDGYKDALIARLSARVSDLYATAGEEAVHSDAISSPWIRHMSAKHHHFAAAAQYRAACDCLEKRKYGEEIARLRAAVACVTDGLSQKGSINKNVLEDLQGLKRRVEEDLKRAEKDNDVIYLQHVPPHTELKQLDRANMAVAKIPPEVEKSIEYLGDHTEFGPPLFSKLVPFAVHLAVSIYEQRRDRTVNENIIQELEAMSDRMQEILSSLNLPGSLQALEKPLGLPGTLVQHAEEIRQAGAIERIPQAFADIERLRATDTATFNEGRDMLIAEEDEDNRLRRKHGTDRWSRPGSRVEPTGQKLWAHASDIEGYLQSSTASDALVREKFTAVRDKLVIMSTTDRVLMDHVPASRRMEIPETLRPAIGRLRSAYNDLLRLQSRRRKKVEALQLRAKADDIKPDIIRETARLERQFPNATIQAAHFEDFFDKRLDDRYESDVEALTKEREDQERLLGELSRHHREFESQKRALGGDKAMGGREREQMLQDLDNAYQKYKEVVNNVEVGRKFYNDLAGIVGQFREKARAWVDARRKEARMLEEELAMPTLSHLSLSNPASPAAQVLNEYFPAQHQQQQQTYQPPPPQLQQQQTRAPMAPMSPLQEPRIQSWVDPTVAPQQPKPKPIMPPVQHRWTPDMGIKFSGPPPSGAAALPDVSPGKKPVPGTWDPSTGIRFG